MEKDQPTPRDHLDYHSFQDGIIQFYGKLLDLLAVKNSHSKGQLFTKANKAPNKQNAEIGAIVTYIHNMTSNTKQFFSSFS